MNADDADYIGFKHIGTRGTIIELLKSNRY